MEIESPSVPVDRHGAGTPASLPTSPSTTPGDSVNTMLSSPLSEPSCTTPSPPMSPISRFSISTKAELSSKSLRVLPQNSLSKFSKDATRKSLPGSTITIKTEKSYTSVLKVPPPTNATSKLKRSRTALPDETPAKRRKIVCLQLPKMPRSSSTAPAKAPAATKKTTSSAKNTTIKSTTKATTKKAAPKSTTATSKKTISKSAVSKSASPEAEGPTYLDLEEACRNAENERDTAETAKLEVLMNALRKKKKIVVIAGAGISVSAGIPDFRSAHGLFKTLKNDHKLKGSGKQLFDASVYNDASMTESFHTMVRNLAEMTRVASPTPFHHMLASLAEEGRLLRLYTQNIDCIDTSLEPLETNVPLNHKGPWPKTIQLHGSVRHMVCLKCSYLDELRPELFVGPETPSCHKCQEIETLRVSFANKRSTGVGRLRPRITLYNERGPDDDAIGAVSLADIKARPDAVIVVGTTMKIPGLKKLTKQLCAVTRDRRDGFTAWINLDSEPAAAEFRDCWDMVVKAKCDDIATLLALPRWDEYRVWSKNAGDNEVPAAEAAALHSSKLEITLPQGSQTTAKGKSKGKRKNKASSYATITNSIAKALAVSDGPASAHADAIKIAERLKAVDLSPGASAQAEGQVVPSDYSVLNSKHLSSSCEDGDHVSSSQDWLPYGVSQDKAESSYDKSYLNGLISYVPRAEVEFQPQELNNANKIQSNTLKRDEAPPLLETSSSALHLSSDSAITCSKPATATATATKKTSRTKQAQLTFTSSKSSVTRAAAASKAKKPIPSTDFEGTGVTSLRASSVSTTSTVPSHRRRIKPRAAKTKAAATKHTPSVSNVTLTLSPDEGKTTTTTIVTTTTTTTTTTVTSSSSCCRQRALPSERPLPPVAITFVKQELLSSPSLSALAPARNETEYLPDSPTSISDFHLDEDQNPSGPVTPCDDANINDNDNDITDDIDNELSDYSTMGSKDEQIKKRPKKYGPTFKVAPMPPPEVPVIPGPPFKMSENGSNRPYKCYPPPSKGSQESSPSAHSESQIYAGSHGQEGHNDTISPRTVPRGMEQLIN